MKTTIHQSQVIIIFSLSISAFWPTIYVTYCRRIG